MSIAYSTNLIGPLLAILYSLFVTIIVVFSTKLLLEVADDSKFKG